MSYHKEILATPIVSTYCHGMPPTATFPAYDRIVGGRLAVLLHRYRDEGLSHEAIALRLEADYAINVSGRTVGRWLIDLEHHGAA
jgi:hypothetical protein